MKRSPELTPLSHDHHQALFAAQQLRRATDPDAASAAVLQFWEAHGRPHFEIEEAILLPGWMAADSGADGSLAARVAAEHLAIRVLIRRARSAELSLAELQRTGELLAAHVRFEERELFPLIEQQLEGAALVELGRELAAAELGCASRPRAGGSEEPGG